MEEKEGPQDAGRVGPEWGDGTETQPDAGGLGRSKGNTTEKNRVRGIKGKWQKRKENGEEIAGRQGSVASATTLRRPRQRAGPAG